MNVTPTRATRTDTRFTYTTVFRSPVQVNGGRARIRGVEVEATARPVEAVTATFGLSRLDTKYLEIAPGAVIPANAVLPFTPKWSLSGGLAYEFEISTAGTMTLRGDWHYRTATYLSAENTPILRQPRSAEHTYALQSLMRTQYTV